MITLFTRSYHKDFEWLKHSVASMRKNLHNISNRVLAVPQGTSVPTEISSFYDLIVFTQEQHVGYIAQQVDKVRAYKHTGDEYIIFSDSDCMYYNPVYALAYLDNERRVTLQRTRYSDLEGNVLAWQGIAKNMTGMQTEWEYMRCFPIMHHRATCEYLDNLPVYNDYLKTLTAHSLSEFNGLGVIAEHVYPSLYNFVDSFPAQYAKQYWSWGGITPEISEEIKCIYGTE